MNKKIRSMAEILYPKRCPLCDTPLLKNERLLCKACEGKLTFVKEPLCLKCGKPAEDSAYEYCRSCRQTVHYFNGGFAPFAYEGKYRESVIRFKYGGRAEYADFYAKAACFYGRKKLERWKPELILPVPVHKERLRKRGYNQSGLFAESISRITGIPCKSDLLERRVRTSPLKELDRNERRKALFEAFSLAGSPGGFKKVLIADDIYTSGSTIDAVSLLLKKAGVKEVYFAVVCIGRE